MPSRRPSGIPWGRLAPWDSCQRGPEFRGSRSAGTAVLRVPQGPCVIGPRTRAAIRTYSTPSDLECPLRLIAGFLSGGWPRGLSITCSLALLPPQRTLLPRPSEHQSHNVCSFSILSNSSVTGKHTGSPASCLPGRLPIFGNGRCWCPRFSEDIPAIPISLLSPEPECARPGPRRAGADTWWVVVCSRGVVQEGPRLSEALRLRRPPWWSDARAVSRPVGQSTHSVSVHGFSHSRPQLQKGWRGCGAAEAESRCLICGSACHTCRSGCAPALHQGPLSEACGPQPSAAPGSVLVLVPGARTFSSSGPA